MHVTLFDVDLSIDASALDCDVATVREWVAEYERGERTDFDVEVTFPDGLTGEVMRAMQRIPPGETRTYGEIAEGLGTAAVAVGQACGRNPAPIVVPCHRVVGADSLGGYSAGGDRGPTLKRRLLEHEGAIGPVGVSTGTSQARLGG